MELSTSDRLALLDILPKEGDYLTLKILRKLRESLSFNEEEHKALRFENEGDIVKWHEQGDKLKDIVIGEKAIDLIVEALKKRDRAKTLTDAHLTVYEKFIHADI